MTDFSLLDQLVSSSALTINRSPDLDHFQGIERLADAHSVPLGWKDFAPSFAAVTLQSCSIYLQRTFPRILQVKYSTAGAIVGLSMDESVSVRLNGVEANAATLLLVKGSAACEVVESQANLIAFVNFESIDVRGWPGESRPGAIAADPAG